MVTQTRFFTESQIPKMQLAILFLLKVSAGLIYGWAGIVDGALNDTWTHHFNSLKQTELLLQDPGEYFAGIFRHAEINGVRSFFSSTNSFWNGLKWSAYIRLISIFNCFSFGNYFINVIFYSYITFWGVVAMYRVMNDQLRSSRRLLIIGCFLVPSFLYWCSGLHKDGLTFLALAMIVYHFYFHVLRNTAGLSSYAMMLLGFFILFIFRNHFIVVLVPALLAWYLAEKRPRRRFKIFALVYITGAVLFFGLKYIHPELDFPSIVAEKQQAFNQLTGGKTSIPVKDVEPNAIGFLKTLPQAVSLSVLRPYLSDIHKPVIIPAFIELVLLWVLFALSLFVRKQKVSFTPFGLFITFFVISVFLMLGYTVNNMGAVARYRSVIFPFFVPALLYAINWQRLKIIKYKKI